MRLFGYAVEFPEAFATRFRHYIHFTKPLA